MPWSTTFSLESVLGNKKDLGIVSSKQCHPRTATLPIKFPIETNGSENSRGRDPGNRGKVPDPRTGLLRLFSLYDKVPEQFAQD